LALIINGYIIKSQTSKKENSIHSEDHTMEIKTIKVEGMTCNHCKMNVESNLEKSGLVSRAQVDLAAKTVRLEGEHIEIKKAKELINSLGYKAE